VTSAPFGILMSIRVTTAQTYIPEEQEMIQADEPNIATPCTWFACSYGFYWNKTSHGCRPDQARR